METTRHQRSPGSSPESLVAVLSFQLCLGVRFGVDDTNLNLPTRTAAPPQHKLRSGAPVSLLDAGYGVLCTYFERAECKSEAQPLAATCTLRLRPIRPIRELMARGAMICLCQLALAGIPTWPPFSSLHVQNPYWASGSPGLIAQHSYSYMVHTRTLGGAPRAPFRRTSLLPSPVSRVSSSRLLLPSRPPYLVGFRFWSALDFLPLSSYLPLAFSPRHSFNPPPPPLPPPPSPPLPASASRLWTACKSKTRSAASFCTSPIGHRPSPVARPRPPRSSPTKPSLPYIVALS